MDEVIYKDLDMNIDMIMSNTGHSRTHEYVKSGAMKEAHKALFIHSDIRPFSSLDQIQTIDKEIVRYIPWLQDIAKSNSYN